MEKLIKGKTIITLLAPCLFFALFICNPALLQAENYPDKAIQFIVPAGSGGGLDRDARGILPYLKKHMSVPIVIQYKPGAGNRIGNEYVFRSAPDGYTIVISSLPGPVYGELRYKPKYEMRKFTPIYAWARMNNSLFVHAETWKTFEEFVQAARSRKIALGLSSGLGGTPHLNGLLLAESLGINFKWVPFKGAAPAFSALIGKHVDAVVGVSKSGLPLVQGGHIRPLLVCAESPDASFPEVPTPKKLGHTIATQPILRGIFAPPGLPKDRARVLENALEKAAKEPQYRDWGEKRGIYFVDYHPKEFSEALEGIYRDVGTIMKRFKAEKGK